MKIVKFKEFLKCPPGTVYSNYQPCITEGFNIKYDTLEYDSVAKDFIYISLLDLVDCNDEEELYTAFERAEKEHVKLDFELTRREGLYDDNRMYCVYSKADVEGLITLLKLANK